MSKINIEDDVQTVRDQGSDCSTAGNAHTMVLDMLNTRPLLCLAHLILKKTYFLQQVLRSYVSNERSFERSPAVQLLDRSTLRISLGIVRWLALPSQMPPAAPPGEGRMGIEYLKRQESLVTLTVFYGLRGFPVIFIFTVQETQRNHESTYRTVARGFELTESS